MAILDRRQDFLDHRVGVGTAATAGKPGEGADRVTFGKARDLVERLGNATRKRLRRFALAAGVADLDTKRARRNEAAGIKRDAEMAEIGRCLFRWSDNQPLVAGLQHEVVVEALGRHEVAFDRDIDLDIERQGGGEEKGDVALETGGPFEMHAVECGLDIGGGRTRAGNGQRHARRRSREIVELEEISRIAFGEVVEEDRNFVEPGLELKIEFGLGLEIAAIGRHPAHLCAVQEEHCTAAGAQANLGGASRVGLDRGAGPGRQPRRPEPETGEVEPRRAEGQPPTRRLECAAHFRPLAAIAFGKDRPTWIFVRDEVLVLGQEEEGVHLALHRLVRHVEALLGNRAELPVADGLPRNEAFLQMENRIAHFSSAKATGVTSLYSWFSPVMPQTKA
ncbi:hypothetical protein D9M72_376990 [compost metagenome]